MAYNPRDSKALPYFVYMGSANLSQSAWGALEQDKKANEATCNTKLIKLSNFECGVMIPGHLIEGLLESGTEGWQSGIVPYVQTGKRYGLPKDRPWNGTFYSYPGVVFYSIGSSGAGLSSLGVSRKLAAPLRRVILQFCLDIQYVHLLMSRQIRDGFRTFRRTTEEPSLEISRVGCILEVL
jgi:hypothetical protein